jgi:predicted ATP-grasp superfamily ATP-dependent carboligase
MIGLPVASVPLMQPGEHLLIFGASVRAAAFSALRAGLLPWCVDRFADADLRARCPTMRLPGTYPNSFADIATTDTPGPWMYTGGLENHPLLVHEISLRRRLWGNDAAVLQLCRQPTFLRDVARDAGLPTPALAEPRQAPAGGRWLLKPLFGSGGSGVRIWSGDRRGARSGVHYLQEHIEGVPAAALFLAAGGTARLLGLTHQLTGVAWLHAPAFGYCGSIGPLPLSATLERDLGHLGHCLAIEGGLHGLFGVDGILRDGAFWPVEINPRYTASVEVLEYATGLCALHLNRLAFEDEQAALSVAIPTRGAAVVGKAILYAQRDFIVPAQGPWTPMLTQPCPIEKIPDFADLPHPGEAIPAGRPVLTILAQGESVPECLAALEASGAEVCASLG